MSLNFEVDYIIPRSFVPLTYLKILLPACQCDSFGDSMNPEIRLTPYIIFGLVAVKYKRLPTSLLNNVGSTVNPSSSLLNLKPVITSIGDFLQLEILNLFKIALACLDYDIKIPLSDC